MKRQPTEREADKLDSATWRRASLEDLPHSLCLSTGRHYIPPSTSTVLPRAVVFFTSLTDGDAFLECRTQGDRRRNKAAGTPPRRSCTEWCGCDLTANATFCRGGDVCPPDTSPESDDLTGSFLPRVPMDTRKTFPIQQDWPALRAPFGLTSLPKEPESSKRRYRRCRWFPLGEDREGRYFSSSSFSLRLATFLSGLCPYEETSKTS